MLDMTDIAIVASFFIATVTLIIYVWRAERRGHRRYDIIDFR